MYDPNMRLGKAIKGSKSVFVTWKMLQILKWNVPLNKIKFKRTQPSSLTKKKVRKTNNILKVKKLKQTTGQIRLIISIFLLNE